MNAKNISQRQRAVSDGVEDRLFLAQFSLESETCRPGETLGWWYSCLSSVGFDVPGGAKKLWRQEREQNLTSGVGFLIERIRKDGQAFDADELACLGAAQGSYVIHYTTVGA